MLRFLRRYSKGYLNQTLVDLNLHPSVDIPPTQSSPSKKIKFSLTSKSEKQVESIETKLQRLKDLTTSSHEVPEEFQNSKEAKDSFSELISSRQESYENFIKGLINIPKEGVHYHEKKNFEPGDGLSSLEIRSYILGVLRSQKAEGNPLKRGDIPAAALKPYDPSMVKIYPRLTPEGKILDVEHWANWYLRNQPEDIATMDMSEWEPLVINQERADNFNALYESLLAEENGNENIDDGDIRKVESGINESYQSDLTGEFIERSYNPEDEFRRMPVASFFENRQVRGATLYTPLERSTNIPPSPPNVGEDYITFNNSIEAWSFFREIPEMLKNMENLNKSNDMFVGDQPWEPVRVPSLYNYYETLPNCYKHHRLVHAITVILERGHPKVPRKTKELALNQLCNLLTPRNPEKYKFLQEYYFDHTGVSTNLKMESSGDYEDPSPRKYEIRSEGEIEIEGSEIYTASEIDFETKQKIEEKLKTLPEGAALDVKGPPIMINDKLPDSILKKYPGMEEKNKERFTAVIKQIYPDEPIDALEDRTEGMVGNSKWTRRRTKHTNLTRGDVYEGKSGEHLKLPEDYEPLELEENFEEKEVVEDNKLDSDIEIQYDKKTGKIKEMRTTRNIDYETSQYKNRFVDDSDLDDEDNEILPSDEEKNDSENSEDFDNDVSDEELGSDADQTPVSGSDYSDESGEDFVSKKDQKKENKEKKEARKVKEESESEEGEGEDEDEESEESSDYGDDAKSKKKKKGSNEITEEEFNEMKKKIGEYTQKSNLKSDLLPEEQLKQLMGEQLSVKAEEEKYYKIYERNVDWFTRNYENSDGPIPSPITFYDNDDGYWNDWIRTKRERAGLPELGSRPHFRN